MLPEPVADESSRRARWLVPIAVGLIVFAIAAPLMQFDKAQGASRYLLTAAIWDLGTVRLDEYVDSEPPLLGRDRAVRDGHTYSDKAPLQPLLALPVYGLYRTLGGEPASVVRWTENIGAWLIVVWTSVLPAAILTGLMAAAAMRTEGRVGAAAALALAIGTMLLPFTTLMFGHVLAALFAFLSFFILWRRSSPAWLFGAGAAAGAAVATEYTAAIAVVILGAYALYRHRSAAVWFAAGGIPFAVLLGVYHTIAFGAPFTTSYQYSAFTEVTDEARSVSDLFAGFSVDNLVAVFFSGRGFLFASSVVVVGLVGLVALLGRRREIRAEIVVALAIFIAFLAIPAFWGNPWGGDSPGPRYMTPALPFLVAGVAYAAAHLTRLFLLAATLSSITMLLATFTIPLVEKEFSASIVVWFDMLLTVGPPDTVFTAAFGTLGWLLHAATVIAAGCFMVWAWRRTSTHNRSSVLTDAV